MTVTHPPRPHVTVAAPVPDPAPPELASWRDALVELLVLAEHGDLAAARSLQGWLSVDPSAASACSTIRRAVAAVRGR
ncbi:hypothetical protein [Actinomycetospora straminea]|uniref:FecR N-terminal domain-containing protein n=1 Tax=Actinomycetospora straminea TaxID=663607 RepID=A0ABP9EMG3_9PSEU|nr:hypothetical protein [Actinomycetospora straminea]MDD7933227.1 hypothetical protein [Actinomycetospora straminea]